MYKSATNLLVSVCALHALLALRVCCDSVAVNVTQSVSLIPAGKSSTANQQLTNANKSTTKASTTNLPPISINETTTTTDDSVYVPVPIAAPNDVGFADASSSGIIQPTAQQQQESIIDDINDESLSKSSLSNDDDSSESRGTKSTTATATTSGGLQGKRWAGSWPKKFQIGYIKQSDLHQVLVESLKADPFSVSTLAAQAMGIASANKQQPTTPSTKQSTYASAVATATPTATKTKRENLNTQQTRVTFDDKPSQFYHQQQQQPSAYLQQQQQQVSLFRPNTNLSPSTAAYNGAHVAKPHSGSMFGPQGKFFNQARFPSAQQHQFGSNPSLAAYVSQHHLQQHQQHQQQQQQQQHQHMLHNPANYFANIRRPSIGSGFQSMPAPMFKNSFLSVDNQNFNSPQQQLRYNSQQASSSYRKQPVYTFQNHQQQVQSDLNSINLNLVMNGPATNTMAYANQGQQQAIDQSANNWQQQQHQPQQPASMLMSNSRQLSKGGANSQTNSAKYSPWRPVEAANKEQQQQQQTPIALNEINQTNQQQIDNNDDNIDTKNTQLSSPVNVISNQQQDADETDFGFSSSKDSTLNGLTNVHPMINNYYSNATLANAAAAAAAKQATKSITKGSNKSNASSASKLPSSSSSGSNAEDSAVTSSNSLKSPMSVARRLNSTTATTTTFRDARKGINDDFATTQASLSTSSSQSTTLPTTTTSTSITDNNASLSPTATTTTTTTTQQSNAETTEPEAETLPDLMLDDQRTTTTTGQPILKTRTVGDNSQTTFSPSQVTTSVPQITTTTTTATQFNDGTELPPSTTSAAMSTSLDGTTTDTPITSTELSSSIEPTTASNSGESATTTNNNNNNNNSSDDEDVTVSITAVNGNVAPSLRLEREQDKPIRKAVATVARQLTSTKLLLPQEQLQQRRKSRANNNGSTKTGTNNKKSSISKGSKSRSSRAQTLLAKKKSARLSQQPQQLVSMSPAQAQSTAQTLASLLLARCMSSSSCASLLDVCATKQGSFQLPSVVNSVSFNARNATAIATAISPTTPLVASTAATTNAQQFTTVNNNATVNAKWAMPVGLASSSMMSLAQLLGADKALKMFAAWKDAVDSALDFSGELGFTLLLPSNEALARLPQATIDSWTSNSDLLDKVIQSHIVDSVEFIDLQSNLNNVQAADNERATAIDGVAELATRRSKLVKARALHINQHRDNTVTINGKRVVYANQQAPANGIIHVIDGLLEWPLLASTQRKPLDIMETLKQCDKFDGFVTLAEGTGLSAILKQDGPMTVFVPSNEALMKIPDNELDIIKSNSTALKEFLLYHVVNGSFFSQDLRDGQQLSSMLNKKPIEVGVRVDGCLRRLVDANTSPMRKPDIAAKNGVIHVLDWYLSVRDDEWCEQSNAKVELATNASNNEQSSIRQTTTTLNNFQATNDATDSQPQAHTSLANRQLQVDSSQAPLNSADDIMRRSSS